MTWRRGLGIVVACVSLVACYQPVYEPAPYAPPPRGLTVTAQRNQSQHQQSRDIADCQSIAGGQATSGESWAQMFAACMGGRGYMVQ